MGVVVIAVRGLVRHSATAGNDDGNDQGQR
jgi:hypothetical protein